jgi:spore germination protein YaaH
LYATNRTDIQYANDYNAINQYCDTVRIMTYDQQTADLKLNAAGSGPYAPIADTKWVEKVIKLATQSIDKKKLSIGIATYGGEYDVTVNSKGVYTYRKLDSFNPQYAVDQASLYNVQPSRNRAGEMSVTFPASTTPADVTSSNPVAPVNTPTGELFATKALAYAKSRTTSVTYRLLSWSDAGAVADKLNLARKYGLRGVSLFKIDGGEDPTLWNSI